MKATQHSDVSQQVNETELSEYEGGDATFRCQVVRERMQILDQSKERENAFLKLSFCFENNYNLDFLLDWWRPPSRDCVGEGGWSSP